MTEPRTGVPATPEIIVAHEMADFDAFAAAVAAQKLYPQASIVLAQHLERSLQSFVALHRDRFPTACLTDIDQARVARMILVDVRRKSRLKRLATLLERIDAQDGKLEVHVFDHHPAADDDVPASFQVVARVGSATTLLVEFLRARALPIDPVEATLFMLGIHEDTGSLTHAGSMPRDASALAWLLERGACVRVMNRYLRPRFGEAQRNLLIQLLESGKTERFGGVEVGFGVLSIGRQLKGLAEVVTQALELRDEAALFGIFGVSPKRVQVVARSRSPLVNVGELLLPFGGGGNPAAASAVVKQGNAERVRQAIAGALRSHPPAPARVRHLMSSPVHTVGEDTPLDELHRSLELWRNTGVPVLRAGSLCGIISRRDLEHAGDLAAPVRHYMTRDVVTANPDESLEAALGRMEHHDVGRLPVLRGSALVGILTRSDVIRALYSTNAEGRLDAG